MTPPRDGAVAATWWILFPPFAALVVRLSIDRTCGDPRQLLGALGARPAVAWAIGLLYVAAHAWMLAAYLITSAREDRLVPRPAAFARVWGSDAYKVLAMAALLAVEYAPLTLWRAVGHAVGCAR